MATITRKKADKKTACAPALLSMRGYAKYRDCAASTVSRAITAGRITVRTDGLINPTKADREWAANTDLSTPRNSVTGTPKLAGQGKHSKASARKAEERAGKPEGETYATNRLERERYRAQLARLEYEKTTGALISQDDVRVACFNAGRTVRDMMLALPDRLAPILAAQSSARECHAILTKELTRALETLASMPGLEKGGADS